MASTQCSIIGSLTGWWPLVAGPGGLADEGLEFVVEGGRVGHRALLVMPRPAVARISRWISLTPPPNVLICA